VRIGSDEPVHMPDKVDDRVQITYGPFAGHSGLCTQISRQQIGVLLLMFKAHRQVRLQRDAVELA